MPYIKPEERDEFKSLVFKMATSEIRTSGQLNYLITKLIHSYMNTHTPDFGQLRYQICNDVIGALEGAKQEFYRRIVAPLEDSKIKEHGDV